MVDNPNRWRELSCNSAYADFLAQEIVAWARANYHATDRPEQTIIGGTSLGGLQAACVGSSIRRFSATCFPNRALSCGSPMAKKSGNG